jgi:2,5-dihydroxypyridine 5,6-dioxygenase
VCSLQTLPVARSTGATPVLQQLARWSPRWPAARWWWICTVEGLMHAPELPAILQGGARVVYVSNEHPRRWRGCCRTTSWKRW